MPNWVYNGLTIEGSPEQVKSLIKQMDKPFVNYVESHGDLAFNVKQIKYVNPIFAFHNIYNYKDAGITDEQYHSQPVRKDGESFAEFMQFNTNDWYNFNNREWGTKWDVAVSEDNKYPDTTIEEAENGENYVVHYNFNTAWSRPLPALQKLSAQYPTLLFTLSYEEETGWGGEMEFLRGEVISESEYENQCRDCDATDQMEYCENDCGEICGNCHWLGEADLEAVAKCEDHKQYLDTKVPEYRKMES
jgi:Ferredoxin-like domain in Api92-like protein